MRENGAPRSSLEHWGVFFGKLASSNIFKGLNTIPMRVIYITQPHYLDISLHRIRSLAKIVELHVILVITPESLQGNILDLAGVKVEKGLVKADPILSKYFENKVCAYWRDTASFRLLSYDCRHTVHFSTWTIGHKAGKKLFKTRPDIIHFEDLSLRLSPLLRKLRKFPIVLSIHDPEFHSGERNWRIVLARRLAFPSVDAFILHSSNSTLVQRFATKYQIPISRIATNYLGTYDVFREWIREPIQSEKKTVLFFGRLSQYKGIEVLYKSVVAVAEQIPNVCFIIAGKCERGYTLPEAPELPNGGHIEVINKYIGNILAAKLFQRASVVACPYIDATQSGVVLTAYAFNKPVVATSTGALPEYIKDGVTGLLVPPRKSGPLADALIKVLSDEILIESFKTGIQKFKDKELDWNNIATTTFSLYKKLLD